MVETLQEYIKNWLSAKKHRSLKQLAEECGLNYGTVRNMADGKAVPNGETILRVLLATTTVENMHAFIQEHLPHLSPYTKVLTQFNTQITKTFTVTRKHCEVLMEVSFGPTTLARLTDKFGPSVPSVVEELVGAEVIALQKDVYRNSSSQLYIPSQALAIEMSRAVLDNLNTNLRGNMILAQSGGVNLETARKIYKIMEAAQAEVLNVIKDPDNSGEYRIAVALAMTTY